MKNQNEIKVVSIRLVDEPPLYSNRALQTAQDVLDTVGEEIRKYDRELFCILNLRSKNQVINMNIVSMGTLSTALVHPREVFKSAILSNAAGIMLIHNHPSGECSPSKVDIEVTKRMAEAGDLMGITVLDHIIVGEQEYYSFRETGMLKSTSKNIYVAEKSQAYEKAR